MENQVILTCVKEKNKLRIKILTEGYYNNANCQFPKNIREEGMKYIVPTSDITISEIKGKYFYRIKKHKIIKCNNINHISKVFNVDNEPCVICLTNEKIWVIIPYGFTIGLEQKCPLCRGVINRTIKYTEIS